MKNYIIGVREDTRNALHLMMHGESYPGYMPRRDRQELITRFRNVANHVKETSDMLTFLETDTPMEYIPVITIEENRNMPYGICEVLLDGDCVGWLNRRIDDRYGTFAINVKIAGKTMTSQMFDTYRSHSMEVIEAHIIMMIASILDMSVAYSGKVYA